MLIICAFSLECIRVRLLFILCILFVLTCFEPLVKHEIFVTDISNCHALLKRTLQELYALGAVSEAQLEMGHPTVR